MRGGEAPPRSRHAPPPTSTARDPNSVPTAGATWEVGFSTSLAQRVVHARGTNWFEGRIAECPRLQQKSSELLITELAVIGSCSSPLRSVKQALLLGPESGRCA